MQNFHLGAFDVENRQEPRPEAGSAPRSAGIRHSPGRPAAFTVTTACETSGMTAFSFAAVASAIAASWGPDTMYATKEVPPRKPGCRSRGQCGTTALVLQDWLGGDILAADVYRDDERVGVHYWNRLPGGEEVDMTAEQFLPNEALVGCREATRPSDSALQAHPGYGPYLILSDRVTRLLSLEPGAIDKAEM